MAKYRRFTESEKAYVLEHYADTDTGLIAAHLGRSNNAINKLAFDSGVKKSAEYMESAQKRFVDAGKASRYKKGSIPANKGRKMPYNANSARTQFKTGGTLHNMLPVGTIVKTSDGYLAKKVSEFSHGGFKRNWRFLHRIVWEEHNGPIPAGYSVIFKDRNPFNCSIENLQIVSRAELGRKNMTENVPPELKSVRQLIGAITRQINRKTENGK